MKVVILCGGRGTRLGEHGKAVPKALTPIGGEPIVVHLMRHFALFGYTDFVLCLGFLREQIQEFFKNSREDFPEWSIELADTGLDTPTGGRVHKVLDKIVGERFMVTYGDGLSDVNIRGLVEFHTSHGKAATLTAVHPISNFGLMELGTGGTVLAFKEKPALREWVNGGFFVFEPFLFDLLDDDTVLESDALTALAARSELMAFRHKGFWKCMDTHKDRIEFEELFAAGAPWLIDQL